MLTIFLQTAFSLNNNEVAAPIACAVRKRQCSMIVSCGNQKLAQKWQVVAVAGIGKLKRSQNIVGGAPVPVSVPPVDGEGVPGVPGVIIVCIVEVPKCIESCLKQLQWTIVDFCARGVSQRLQFAISSWQKNDKVRGIGFAEGPNPPCGNCAFSRGPHCCRRTFHSMCGRHMAHEPSVTRECACVPRSYVHHFTYFKDRKYATEEISAFL